MNNLQGKVLGNRYVLLDKIGDGGMALVYKARCQLLNRFVAVKILRHEYTTDEEFIKKFKRESLAAASLSHPNIVGIYDVGEQEGIYYIVMEYVNGQTLKEYIKKHIKINYEDTLKIAYQIALALEHAHKNGVVHRDIKPHNILITDEKIVKVTDFGIARASTSTTMTNTGRVMGSVHYVSPEQARGTFSDHRTDIYSLGVVMYEMLTGKLPYDAESPISVALKHIQDNLVKPSDMDKNIPKAVNDIVVKAMEKDMNKRYQSVRELINDIFLAQSNPNMTLLSEPDNIQSTRVIPVEEIEEAIDVSNRKRNENKKRRSIWRPILIGLIIFAALAGALAYGYGKFMVAKDVKVPKVVGFKEDDARKLLEDAKLKMEVENRQPSDKPEGEVIRAYPEEGLTVKENSVIKVIISSGPKKVKVPDLSNLDYASAEAALKRVGLSIGNTEKENSDKVKKDLIISQSQAPNSEVMEGSEIDIVISEGPPQPKLVTVPQLKARTREEAEAMLKSVNLTLGEVKYGVDNKFIDNVVIDQDVTQGIQVKEGTAVGITINKLGEQGDTGSQGGTGGQGGTGDQVTPKK